VKPRILLVIDKPGWAYDICAHGMSKELSKYYEFDFVYVIENPFVDFRGYDLIYVYFWGEMYQNKFGTQRIQVIKEISSHRWERQEKYGLLSPQEMVKRYLSEAGTYISTSLRLYKMFKPFCNRLFHCSNGFDPDKFYFKDIRNGPLRIGWVGNPSDLCKNFRVIIIPLSNKFNIDIASGNTPHNELLDFYNHIDVICIASDSEGTPLPLIEAMACGCFPVCTDVGVVPEIISNNENGLIVERSYEAFARAFDWCEQNLQKIRANGRKNADFIKAKRSWPITSNSFYNVIEDTLKMIKKRKVAFNIQGYNMESQEAVINKNNDRRNSIPSLRELLSLHYASHYSRINPGCMNNVSYMSNCKYIEEDIAPLVPKDVNSRLVDIGIGHGYLIRYLLEKGYKHVGGIDNCEELVKNAQVYFGKQVEFLVVADAIDFLLGHPDEFDGIFLIDVIEHFTLENVFKLFKAALGALKHEGRIIIRTPNMANILGVYSRYMDLTHSSGFTDSSLVELLEVSGFIESKIHLPFKYKSIKRALAEKLNCLLHKLVYKLNNRHMPLTFGKNVVAFAKKGHSFSKLRY